MLALAPYMSYGWGVWFNGTVLASHIQTMGFDPQH